MEQNNKYKIKIKNINLTKNNFIIESTDNQIFTSKIKHGSVKFKIYNEDNNEVNLNNINENQLVTIYSKNKSFDFSNDLETAEKNNIIIKKIIIKNNYVFNSVSSEEIDYYG